jgi:hypothetical protein
MCNVDYKRMLSPNYFGIFTFTFHLKILFIKFPRQCIGYHIVNNQGSEYPSLVNERDGNGVLVTCTTEGQRYVCPA